MTTYRVEWSVTEHVNGHGGLVRDGDETVVASGKVDKEADSEEEIHSALIEALKHAYPKHDYGPTYDIDRTYQIKCTPLAV